jgi:predicted alpha/beta hydrolase family esterase
MKNYLLFIQGAGGGAWHEDKKLVEFLQDKLADNYEVIYPKMPKEDQPEYKAWKTEIAKELNALNGKVILVGHSLGGSVLLKYLSEENIKTSIAGVFLIATPYWGTKDWQADQFILDKDFASRLGNVPCMFLYHSRDDDWVPFTHLGLYAKKLRGATIREFSGRGHQFNNNLAEVVEDIKQCQISAV